MVHAPRAMQFSGTYTALITPFRDGAVDVTAFQALIERQIAGGVDGIVPVGTTGQSPALTHEEHEGLRMSALAELQPDLAAALKTEQVQAAHLREAMRVVAEELRQEAPSALTELGTIDPQTAQMLHG